MFNWFRMMVESAIVAVFDALSWFIDNTVVIVLGLVVDLLQWFLDQMPDFMGDINLAGKLAELWQFDGIELALYLIPLKECFAIWLLGIGTVGFIRSARYLVGLIPGLEG